MRILVIEDDPDIGRLVRLTFERDRQDVAYAGTASEGLTLARDWAPDVVVLDLMLPDMSGFEVLKELRRTSDVPVVILTAKGLDADRVAGLDTGADDYIVKPFSTAELAARVRAVTRRGKRDGLQPAEALEHRDLVLDPQEHRVRSGNRTIELTKREFEILRMLMQHPGKLISRSAISHAVWGRPAADAKNLLDVHMSALRKKLDGRDEDSAVIETVRGEGFRLL